MSKKESLEKSEKISKLENANTGLREEVQSNAREISHLKTSYDIAANQRDDYQGKLSDAQKAIAQKDEKLGDWYDDFVLIAEDLVDNASPELIQRYEARGLHKRIGENIWKQAKDTKETRIAEKESKRKGAAQAQGQTQVNLPKSKRPHM